MFEKQKICEVVGCPAKFSKLIMNRVVYFNVESGRLIISDIDGNNILKTSMLQHIDIWKDGFVNFYTENSVYSINTRC